MPRAMADASATRVTAEPPLRDWRLAQAGPREERHELAAILDTLGLHDTPFDPARPVIATGHQAWFWHPGILAKDLAMSSACERLGAQQVHLVVDHINNAALAIDVPVRQGDALTVETLRLGSEDLALGTGQRPPLEPGAVGGAVADFEQTIEGETLVDLSVLRDAASQMDQASAFSLADSITAMQLAWMRPMCSDFFVLRTSQLARLACFEALVGRMLQDAERCVSAYNEAVARVPEAGVAPLLVERDRVELPLWVVDASGRGRVFADLADHTPMLTREDGTPIERVQHSDGTSNYPLAPKALTLTAFMRSALCDLFIHGTGGGVYEQVTEHWWRQWGSGTAVSSVEGFDGRDAHPTTLAPLTVVSADIYLDTDAPVASQAQLDHAVWFRHHLPHNIDRYLADSDALDAGMLDAKRHIVSGTTGDHLKPARRAARRELRAINQAFAKQHPRLIADADTAVHRARQGVANAAIVNRRDWCFAFYPPEKLAELRRTIAEST
ncbi:hypothetical protein OT109_05185 [Phycisphaeraceae bacterium D3-23]